MIESINKIVWSISSVLLVTMGLYFTFKLNFVQVHLNKMIKSI